MKTYLLASLVTFFGFSLAQSALADVTNFTCHLDSEKTGMHVSKHIGIGQSESSVRFGPGFLLACKLDTGETQYFEFIEGWAKVMDALIAVTPSESIAIVGVRTSQGGGCTPGFSSTLSSVTLPNATVTLSGLMISTFDRMIIIE